MSGKWYEVKDMQVPVTTVTDATGAVIEILASPYDVPLAVHGEYVQEKGRFVIDLKYMTSGEPTEEQTNGHLVFVKGKRSGRIYRIELDVNRMSASSVSIRVAVYNALAAALSQQDDAIHAMRSANAKAVQATLASTPELYSLAY
ncbi:MAG: hypothetical protein IPJ77_24460 [Planctomycetes bacterium]|nr:hypothetical protein [Planctomycetota bacterium]